MDDDGLCNCTAKRTVSPRRPAIEDLPPSSGVIEAFTTPEVHGALSCSGAGANGRTPRIDGRPGASQDGTASYPTSMLPRPPASVTRSAFGGVSGFFAPAAPGTHQLRQSTVSVAVAFAGRRCSVDAGGSDLGERGRLARHRLLPLGRLRRRAHHAHRRDDRSTGRPPARSCAG